MTSRPETESFVLEGPAGPLEALIERPNAAPPVGTAVVCHPHPLHGGTMTNKVAHTLARSFTSSGFAALRFNFRGVGQSAGAFDDGRGEIGDVEAAAAWLRAQMPDLPLWLSGFSFGAAMAVHAALRCRPAGLISIAPAVSRFVGTLESQPDCPWLVLQGDRDELVDIEETIAWMNELEPGPELEVFPDTEHFFHGKLNMLREAVEAFIRANAQAPLP